MAATLRSPILLAEAAPFAFKLYTRKSKTKRVGGSEGGASQKRLAAVLVLPAVPRQAPVSGRGTPPWKQWEPRKKHCSVAGGEPTFLEPAVARQPRQTEPAGHCRLQLRLRFWPAHRQAGSVQREAAGRLHQLRAANVLRHATAAERSDHRCCQSGRKKGSQRQVQQVVRRARPREYHALSRRQSLALLRLPLEQKWQAVALRLQPKTLKPQLWRVLLWWWVEARIWADE
jgi:hypothetical protein